MPWVTGQWVVESGEQPPGCCAHLIQNLRACHPKSLPWDFRPPPSPPREINGQNCGPALPWSSNFRASFILTKAKK